MEVKRSFVAALGVIVLGSSFAAQASFTDLDTSFGNGGTVTITDPETTGYLADIQDASEGADGNIYLLVGTDEVARLTPSGVLDKSFGTNGFLVLSGASSAYTIYDLAVDSAGQKIYVATQDNANVTDTSTAVTLAAFDFSGNPVTTFGTSGAVSFASLGNATSTGLQLLSNGGGLLLDGYVELQGSSPPAVFAVEVSSAGVPSSTFGTSGVAQLSVPTTTAGLGSQSINTYKATVDSAGRVYVAGGGSADGTVGLLARFTAAGQPDSSFGSSGLVAQSLTTTGAEAEFELVSVQADGSIVAFGSYETSSSSNSYTGVLYTFNTAGTSNSTPLSNADNNVPSVPNYLQQTDGKFVIVNEEASLGSTSSPNVVRLLGTSATTGTTSGGTTTGGTTGTTSTSSSGSGGGSGSASPLMLLLGFAAFLRRKFVKA